MALFAFIRVQSRLVAMISLRDIRRTYRMGDVDVHALRGVSLEIADGDFVAIMGPSGSGKSTLMHIVGLLDAPDEGMYVLNGRDVSALPDDELARYRAQTIGFVFQQFNLLPRLSALENVELPLTYGEPEAPLSPGDLLTGLGLGARLRHAPNELSGGQQQRVAIARALINRPVLIMADEPTGNLDSSSAAEILRVLSALHASGLTVIVVTHDPDVAALARRIITLRDGRIVTDTVNAVPAAPVPAPATDVQDRGLAALLVAPVGGGGRPPRRGLRRWRLWREGTSMMRQAGRALLANKTRTFLSMLGVLIGVAAVIAMLALGAGARAAIEQQISSMGANLLVVHPGSIRRGGVTLDAASVARMTLDDAELIRREAPGISGVAPIVRGGAQLIYGNQNRATQVVGTTPSYVQLHVREPQFGRFFTEEDVRNRARVAVVGSTVARELFGGENPVGRIMRVDRVYMEVVGVMPETGASMRWDPNDQILIPITTAMRRLLGKDHVDMVEVQVRERDEMEMAEAMVKRLLLRRYRLPLDEEDAFRVRNMADLQQAITETSDTMAMLLASIGIISLLVGGIGIMNIMLVSVTERTREIGVRKAIGARRGDILAQFLVEAAFVSACGGGIGILLGCGAAAAMSHFAEWTVVITAQMVLLAFGFSALVGVVFGFWPALKASSLHPIDALRYE